MPNCCIPNIRMWIHLFALTKRNTGGVRKMCNGVFVIHRRGCGRCIHRWGNGFYGIECSVGYESAKCSCHTSNHTNTDTRTNMHGRSESKMSGMKTNHLSSSDRSSNRYKCWCIPSQESDNNRWNASYCCEFIATEWNYHNYSINNSLPRRMKLHGFGILLRITGGISTTNA